MKTAQCSSIQRRLLCDIEVKVTSKDGRQRKVTVLDNNGYAVDKECETSTAAAGFTVVIPKDTIYVVLTQ